MGNTITSISVERVRVAQTVDLQSIELDEFKDYLEERTVLLKEIVLAAVSHTIHSGKVNSDLKIRIDDLPAEIAKAKLTDSATFHKLVKETGMDELIQEIQAHGFRFDIQASKSFDGSYKGKIEVTVPSKMLRGSLGNRAIAYDRVQLLSFMLGHALKEEVTQSIYRAPSNLRQAFNEGKASYSYDKNLSLKFDLDIPENIELTTHLPEISHSDVFYLLNGQVCPTSELTDNGKLLLSMGLTINHIYEEYLTRGPLEPFTLSYVLNEIRKDPDEWMTTALKKNPMTDHKDLCVAYIERLKEITVS